MSWWIKIIFIKSQPSSRRLFNILCDETGNTRKAWQNAYLKENTCPSCEPTKAVQPAFFMKCYFFERMSNITDKPKLVRFQYLVDVFLKMNKGQAITSYKQPFVASEKCKAF